MTIVSVCESSSSAPTRGFCWIILLLLRLLLLMSCEGDCHYNVLVQECALYHYDHLRLPLLLSLMAMIIKAHSFSPLQNKPSSVCLPWKEVLFAKATRLCVCVSSSSSNPTLCTDLHHSGSRQSTFSQPAPQSSGGG